MTVAGETQSSVTVAAAPYFILRVAALPYDVVEQLSSAELCNSATKWASLDSRRIALGTTIAADLHARVANAPSASARRLLIQLKRDVFNGRLLGQRDRHRELDDTLQVSLAEYDALILDGQRLEEDIRRQFQASLEAARTSIRDWLTIPAFERGLWQSSPALHSNLAKYIGSSPSSPSHRDQYVEGGLLRYLVRAATKATPFATFCTILPGKVIAESTDRKCSTSGMMSLHGDLSKPRSMYRTNRALLGTLWNEITRDPDIRGRLILELNSTLQLRGESWRFVDTKGRNEALQQVAANPALNLIISSVSRGGDLRYDGLVALLSDEIGVSVEINDIRRYLDRLVDMGLLRFRSTVGEQDAEWGPILAKQLEATGSQRAADIADLCRKLEEEVRCCGDLDDDRRLTRLKHAHEIGASLCAFVGRAAATDRQVVVHEDYSADCVATLEPKASTLLNDIGRWVAATSRLSRWNDEHAAMSGFFRGRYGPTARVPLIEFYEDYYRDVVCAEGQHAKTVTDSGMGDAPETRRAARQALVSLIAKRWADTPHASSINLEFDEIEKLTERLPQTAASRCSITIFAQLITDESTPRGGYAVLSDSSLGPGYGKYMSRFLSLLPSWLSNDVASDNASDENEKWAEIAYESYFNGNLHPEIMEWKIAYPTSTSARASNCISVTDLCVGIPAAEPDIVGLFETATQTRVFPVDLGFLSTRGRPPLFQLMSTLAPNAAMRPPIPDSLPGEENQSSIVHRPRITIGGSVVIARRRGTVSSQVVPRFDDTNVATSFLRVTLWRKSNGIPDVAYVKFVAAMPDAERPKGLVVDDESAPEAENDVASNDVDAFANPDMAVPARQAVGVPVLSRARANARKPQFIDFNSPILLRIFDRMLAQGQNTLIIEECLPSAAQLLVSDGKRFASEAVLQFEVSSPDQST